MYELELVYDLILYKLVKLGETRQANPRELCWLTDSRYCTSLSVPMLLKI